MKIIDVNAGDINQLGIDWGTAVSLGGKKIAFNTGLNDGGASGFSTVISDTSRPLEPRRTDRDIGIGYPSQWHT